MLKQRAQKVANSSSANTYRVEWFDLEVPLSMKADSDTSKVRDQESNADYEKIQQEIVCGSS